MNTGADPRIMELVRAAEQSAQSGRADDAWRQWESVLKLDPNHPRALFRLGERALRAGDLESARAMLKQAAAAAPNEPGIFLNLALVERARGDMNAELAALDRALVIDEALLPGYLMKGALFERAGKIRQAAKVYKSALALAPEQGLPNDIAQALVHGREVVEAQSDALERFLTDKLAPLRLRHSWVPLERFDEALGIAVGKRKVFVHRPAHFLFPQLPAIGFYDEAQFPWLEALEAHAPAIRDELAGLIEEQSHEFAPYVIKPENVPVQQWGELNRSTKWSAYFLWKDGTRQDEHCTRCPVTTRAVESMPMADMKGYAPTAFFSSLEPGTHIPPHTGSTNVRLIVHLPLIVPPNCRFRVANEWREWQFGKAWVFDDSIEHEAINGSDQQRVVLIFDTWNPHLTAAERELIVAMQTGMSEYYAAE
jgi:aspartyl/asparaginyl beta-hydroxylase (cupin superfamily)/predicted TPR repeat methyltransferase